MEQRRIKSMGTRCLALLVVATFFFNCKNNEDLEKTNTEIAEVKKQSLFEFGFKLDDFIVKKDTIRSGDTFGAILDRNHLAYPKIFEIVEKITNTFNVRSIRPGKAYTLLCAKDSLQTPQTFIYQPNKEDYIVVNFKDSITAYRSSKPIKYVEREVSANIKSTISEALEDKGVSLSLAYKMSDIYAWTIDFTRLQKKDYFKVIYTEKYIDDTIYAGIENIKAAYFNHNKEPFYAFEFVKDSTKAADYYNENAKSLRRAFLKAPVEFKRISSRFNLKRRIAFYGNKIRPHKGTDFAAAVGTPIVSTANGTVEKSAYARGNGNYVKVKHNSTYSTQYLHMQKRLVTVGQYVKQGQIIGYVGMTGNTSGPHVCYRFWKNGVQVDPFALKLPASEPLEEKYKPEYFEFIKPLKKKLDNIKTSLKQKDLTLQDNQITFN